MAYIKVSQLPATTTIADTDVIMIIDNSGFPPVSKQITFGNFLVAMTGSASFGVAVSGLLPVKNISGSGYINVSSSSGNFTVSVTGLQPSGNYANTIHSHGNITNSGTIGSTSGLLVTTGASGIITTSSGINSTYISDFTEAVQDVVGASGFLVGVSGISISYNDAGNTLTIASSGGGGGATISNAANNRVLTSDGTSTGINGESNLTFDGSLLSVSGNLIAISGTYNQVVFNTSLADPDLSQGQLQWNSTEGTLDLGFTDTYSQHIGEELHYRVRNNTASTLVKGTAVYASGLTPGGNNRIEIAPFIADGSVREVRFMGLVTEDISNGVNGYTTQFGYIRGIDTRGDAATNGTTNKLWTTGEPSWAAGDILYAHPTVAGKLTKVEPKHSISVAIILNRHQNQGKIFVRSTSFGHLSDNHDVNISGVTNGQFLQYNSATDYWIASSSGYFTAAQVSGNLNVSATGDINVLKINKFYHNNLSVATGVADSSLLITIVDPTGTPTTQVISGSGLRNSLLNQPAVLRFRQGTEAERILFTPASGEPIWTTDSQKFYIGDGSTAGGDFMGPSPYARSSGTQSITALNTNCVSSGNYSSVLGGENNIIQSVSSHALICGGKDNLIDSDTNDDCSVIGGRNNKITGYSAYRSTIVGGYSNTISSANSYNSVIGGGENNTLSGNYNSDCVIAGGSLNTISSTYNSFSTIGGGESNTISSSPASNIPGGCCTIAGGSENNIFGDQSYNTIGGGYNNEISSQTYPGSTIAGGSNNTISNDYSGGSTIGGGHDNIITSIGSTLTPYYGCIPGGIEAKVTRHGELSHSAGKFASAGDAQHTILTARRTTTDATANQILNLDNSSLRLILPAKTTWTFEVKLSAYNDSDSAGAGWIFRGAIRRNGANGTALIGSIIEENWKDTAMSSTAAGVVADDTNEALEIRVTGLASKNIRWVAVVDISQVSYGTP